MTRESRDTVRDGGDPDTRPLTIAIAGNPNCGKSALFNALTGIRQRTGNWPGVTVDRKEGRFDLLGRDTGRVRTVPPAAGPPRATPPNPLASLLPGTVRAPTATDRAKPTAKPLITFFCIIIVRPLPG